MPSHPSTSRRGCAVFVRTPSYRLVSTAFLSYTGHTHDHLPPPHAVEGYRPKLHGTLSRVDDTMQAQSEWSCVLILANIPDTFVDRRRFIQPPSQSVGQYPTSRCLRRYPEGNAISSLQSESSMPAETIHLVCVVMEGPTDYDLGDYLKYPAVRGVSNS